MNIAIIAAAGSGNRMASDRPKQFLSLAGIPIILHTVKAFEQCDDIQEIIVVLPADQSAEFLTVAAKHNLRKVARIVPGGVTRADSVKRGFLAIRSATAGIIAIHDGVRPFVTVEEISKTVRAAEVHGAAILVAPVVDTIKRVSKGMISETLQRSGLRHALTPQCFRYDLLHRAYETVDVSDPSLTDDSIMVERTGADVAIVEGSAKNIKITTPQDLLIAEAYLKIFEF